MILAYSFTYFTHDLFWDLIDIRSGKSGAKGWMHCLRMWENSLNNKLWGKEEGRWKDQEDEGVGDAHGDQLQSQ